MMEDVTDEGRKLHN